MATTNLGEMFALQQSKDLPPCPSAAYLLGCTFVKLGGFFSIGSNGHRYIGHPCYFEDGKIPQLPDTKPHEQFHTSEEHAGAIKMLEGLIRKLDESDRDLLFSMLAPVAVDERKFTPSIEEPRRAA